MNKIPKFKHLIFWNLVLELWNLLSAELTMLPTKIH